MHQWLTKPSRGFVLLLTLLLIPVAAVAMAGVCRLSMARALKALRAQEDLQRRWGQRSCQVALWAQAQAAIEQANQTAKVPVVALRLQLQLGNQQIDILFADEQCKVNVNRAYWSRGLSGTRQTVALLMQHDQGNLSIALHPAVAGTNAEVGAQNPPASKGAPSKHAKATKTSGKAKTQWQQPFVSLGQIFVSPSAPALLGSQLPSEAPSAATRVVFYTDATLPPAPVDHLTAWGDGKVNFRRASRLVIAQTCLGVLGPQKIGKLLDLRVEQPGAGLHALLNQLQLTGAQRSQVDRLLTDYSSCYSMWMVTDTGRRRWYRLAIYDSMAPATVGAQVFDW